MVRILSIDPSGTGTTGIFFTDGKKEEFYSFVSKDWKEHLNFIQEMVQKLKVNTLIYENTNFINSRNRDSLNLIRLLGSFRMLAD
jgi:hypothetical protein